MKRLGKLKIHEIAKELGISSKDVMEKAKAIGIEVTSHLSSVEEEVAAKIRKEFGKKTTGKPEKKDEPKKEVKKDGAPVIIRREVIVSEEEEKKEVKPERNHRQDVGFVERNRNKDYNIVYRNKPSKPLTVDELFGIKKEKKEEAKKPDEKKTEVVI